MSGKPSECEELLLPEEKELDKYTTKKKYIGKRKNRFHKAIEILPKLLRRNKKKSFTIFIVFGVILIYLNSWLHSWDTIADKICDFRHSQDYLVYSDKCQIPNMDPHTSDVMKYFKRQKYEPCTSNESLTITKYYPRNKIYILRLEETLRDNYTKYGEDLNCCYNVIERSGTGTRADKDYNLSECVNFTKTVRVPTSIENILVKCKSDKLQTYINAHAMIPERPNIRKRLDKWRKKDTKRPISVLLLGIDSISRQNLLRAMPKTAQYLNDSEWFEMSGYNKVAENTFQNLMAILAGYNQTTTKNKCNPYELGRLDKCPLIWYDFQKYGYVTAYGEDETNINTFNNAKRGFQKPPADYYLRPFLLAAEEHLPVKLKSGLKFCLGYQHSAEYVFDYALELATNYWDDPYFGLFWSNSFSHNRISDCSSMDHKMIGYLKKFSDRGILNRSVIIFFSDHGIKLKASRELHSGYYEDRMPFMFIWLPPWLKNDHPEFVDALNLNKNRLTNPYDVHMTLKHILELSGRANKLPNAEDCPNCQTLLRPVPYSRSCEDIAIHDRWCACYPFKIINPYSPVMNIVMAYTINYLNEYVASFKNISVELCAKISLHKIKSVHQLMPMSTDSSRTNSKIDSYRIVFETRPERGLFEATVLHNSFTNDCKVLGSITRLTSYKNTSKCINHKIAKEYCFCKKKFHASNSTSG